MTSERKRGGYYGSGDGSTMGPPAKAKPAAPVRNVAQANADDPVDIDAWGWSTRDLPDVDAAIATVRDACDRFDHRGTDRHDPTREPLPERIVIDEIERLRGVIEHNIEAGRTELLRRMELEAEVERLQGVVEVLQRRIDRQSKALDDNTETIKTRNADIERLRTVEAAALEFRHDCRFLISSDAAKRLFALLPEETQGD